MERLTSMEFSEILADYGLEPWGEDWQRTAYLASAMAVTKSGQPIKDYKSLIPRKFAGVYETFVVNTEEIDAESVFRRMTSGGSR